MKKIALLFAAALLLHLLPAHATAEFYLKINRSGRYTVYFADQKQYTISNQFRFFDLAAGMCNLRIVDEFSKVNIFNGTVTLTEGVRTVAELDNFGAIRVIDNIQVQHNVWYLDSYPYMNNNSWSNNSNWNNGNNWNNWNGNNWSGNYGNGWNGYNGNDQCGNGGSNNWNNQVTAVDDNTFRSLKDYVSKQSFDNSRLSAAKEVTRSNRLKSSQVADLCRLFSFDDNRLEYAKYAYDYVIDKNNYYQVNNTFSFTSNADELRAYIMSH